MYYQNSMTGGQLFLTKRREPPKVPCKMEVETDRINNLPGHILDKVLSYLSLRDAVRTSILSSKWRYRWASLSHLVFDDQSVVYCQDHAVFKNKLVNVIDHVLLLHNGPIHKFKLSHRDFQGTSDINRWLLFLSRGPVKELILEIWKGLRYKLPSSLFLCQKLIHLELFNCLLKSPSTFNGFRSLKSLDLQHITMDQDEFEHLIASCLLLERLTLMNFEGFTHVNIFAPNLVFFDIGGVFEDVNFENTDCLAIVSIGLYVNANYNQILTPGNTCNLIGFFAHLPRIQRLEVQSFFLKYLASGKVPRRLPTPSIELNYLSLRVSFDDKEETCTALCILRSCPNLQELEILVRTDEEGALQMGRNILEEDYQDVLFKQLLLVKIVGINGNKSELTFINFLLANSPVLETMSVRPSSVEGGWELLKQLLRFRRASVRAEIIYLDPVS